MEWQEFNRIYILFIYYDHSLFYGKFRGVKVIVVENEHGLRVQIVEKAAAFHIVLDKDMQPTMGR